MRSVLLPSGLGIDDVGCCGKGGCTHEGAKTERKERFWEGGGTKLRTLGLGWTSSYRCVCTRKKGFKGFCRFVVG